MKREELVRYDGEWYDANIVDCLLDEKDAEIEKWKKEFEHDARFISCRMCEERFKKYIDELKAEIESLKASHYAEMVDAGMRERSLRRALWLARALRAMDIQRWWLSVTLAPIIERACRVWNNIEIKCLKKAEEYK